MAAEIAKAETWAEPTEAEVTTFLVRLMNGEQFTGTVPPGNLDRAEAGLEAA
ncbi:hypothetical protein O7606_13400 [Micromonospora sp. WMMD882]|uniref:hypothetical protein n=1 Tax=Micromonospora sp. WMMD882 TaxID=3015151 RepID=UPI00248AB3E8|nr:hypothetical protein [Micromonospora sp. WMMD882]WBB77296.1 hypothetical protein O7606_13400 [Micromonospora sp. WMMD882]